MDERHRQVTATGELTEGHDLAPVDAVEPINTQLYAEVAATTAPDASAEAPRELPGWENAEEREYAAIERYGVLVHRRGGEILSVGLVVWVGYELEVPGFEDDVAWGMLDAHARRVRGKVD